MEDFSNSPNPLGSPKGIDREKWPLRGMFDSLQEAISLADGERYVALGPEGGYSVFRLGELPSGDVESEDRTLWPLESTIVFLPPDYQGEPAKDVFRSGRIGFKYGR
jgi:hypothetical protein